MFSVCFILCLPQWTRAQDNLEGLSIHAVIKKLVLSGTIDTKRIDEAYSRITALKTKYKLITE
mgnify:CR=1 FL=1